MTALDDTLKNPTHYSTDNSIVESSSKQIRSGRRTGIDPNQAPTEEEIALLRAAELNVSAIRAKSWESAPGNTLIYFVGSCEAKFWRFKFEELEALVELYSHDNTLRVFDRSSTSDEVDSPFLFTNFPSESLLRSVASRACTIRGAYECYGKAQTIEQLAKQIQSMPRSIFEPYVDAKTYCMDVITFGYTLQQPEKQVIRDHFSCLNFSGNINLVKPDVKFTVFVEYMTKRETPPECRNTTRKVTPIPIAYYFCREIIQKDLYHAKYELTSRPYIGPTSTDAQLAFLMTNFCKVRPNQYVFDPFVGTGSILVASAHWGALCIGQDLDWKVIHGKMKGKQHTLFDNFKHYGLRAPDIVCSDNSRPAWRLGTPMYDAIICDPPYGIRAGARRLGLTERNIERQQHLSNEATKATEEPKKDETHMVDDSTNKSEQCVSSGYPNSPFIPMTKPYPVEEVMYDLLHLSAKQLRVGGRLCYLLPVHHDFEETELPVHPCLKTIYNCEQILQGEFSRRAITAEKIIEFDPELHESWITTIKQQSLPRWANLHDEIMLKESGSLKKNGRIHLTKSERRKIKEENLKKGLPVSKVFLRQHERRQQKLQERQQKSQPLPGDHSKAADSED